MLIEYFNFFNLNKFIKNNNINNRSIRSEKLFLIFLFFINAVLSIYSTPVIDLGDAGVYILFSEVILGKVDANFAHRSPLYPLIIAGLRLVFSPPLLFKVIVVLQYFLVFLTAWMIYLEFKPLFTRLEPPMLIALLFNLSLSTIYYANIIFTEILTVFLLTVSIYWLLKIYQDFNYKNFIILGIVLGLLSLARFNAIPIIITFLVLILYFFYNRKLSISLSLYSILLFIVPYLLILNLWCIYNYKNYNFYGLFPYSGSLPRNAIVSSIRPENKVPKRFEPILAIFLEARKEYFKLNKPRLKDSFAKFDIFGALDDLYSGYMIYNIANPDLRKHFNFMKNEGEYEMNLALLDFYNEIYNQNKKFILKMRFLSFLSGFRAAATSLPQEYGKINTNFLPSFVFELYKVSIIIISLFVFFSVIVFIYNILRKKNHHNNYLLIYFFVVFSFWGINFYFVTVGDANRYKFPAEPFIFGLFVYYFYKGVNWWRTRYRLFRGYLINARNL